MDVEGLQAACGVGGRSGGAERGCAESRCADAPGGQGARCAHVFTHPPAPHALPGRLEQCRASVVAAASSSEAIPTTEGRPRPLWRQRARARVGGVVGIAVASRVEGSSMDPGGHHLAPDVPHVRAGQDMSAGVFCVGSGARRSFRAKLAPPDVTLPSRIADHGLGRQGNP